MHVPSEGSPSSLPVRQAVASDLPRLVALERAAFTSDRLSERSLRAFLKAPTAILLVTDDAADAPLSGYALILLRKGTGLARLYSLAVSPARRGQGLAHGLLQAAEDAAYEADRMVLRLEVREDNGAALALYRRAGYRPFERIPAYYEDGMAALRMQKHLRAETPKGAPAYYEQTTDFTCGPACALMALGGLGLGAAADAAMELRLWREATTVFMTSGLGGCDPYGLAVALARRGARTAIHINTGDLLFLESVRNEDKRAVMRLAQEDFRNEAEALAIPTRPALDAAGLAEAVGNGALAIVLISGWTMFAKQVPHWILVWGADDDHLFIHDPWVEDSRDESHVDAASLPIPRTLFDRMARWGRAGLKAAIIVTRSHGDAAG